MSDRNGTFDAFIDEIHEGVTIGGIDFDPSDILFSCDPIAYSVMLSDWESNYSLDEDEEEQPDVCSAEDAWNSMTDKQREWYAPMNLGEFTDYYNRLNNL